MASITGWTRLEPRPRSRDFARALEARVHDPLWLLVRQWQVGEFKGDDAGSLTAARLEIDTTPVNRYQPGANGTARPYDLRRLPLEALVERERVRAAVSNGDEPAPGASDISTDFDLRLAAEATTTLDAASHRFVSVVAGRAPDGFALEADLRRALALEPPVLPPEPQ